MTRIAEVVSDWIADHPMSVPGRVAARRFGRPTGALPPIVQAGDTGTRLLIAPANYAGQATAWAQALMTERADITAKNYALASPFGYPADAVIPAAVFHNSRPWQIAQQEAARRFTHFLVESFIPPFGRLLGRDLGHQLASLGDGVDVALLCHGSDVRRPSLNAARNPLTPHGDDHATRRAEAIALRNLATIQQSGRRVFVSTPDLLDDVADAQWCPVVVDPATWAVARAPRSGPPRVLHAPSKAAAKGSAIIEPVLERLAARGIIEYTPVRGIPHERMPDVYATADIVVDQLWVGSYGVAACEAMAAGCAVVGHVTPAVRERVRADTDTELPIVEADAASLEDAVVALAADAARRDALSRDAAAFVDAVHSGPRSARVLLSSWIEAA